ncbi:MAG: DUF4287 domain-containing protein [Bryobacteraceae bacterium]|nr:DUF4287 domain-containing protein [Bryobacteraceae bacterium]
MSDPQKALTTQLSNIERRTGKTLEELKTFIHASGLTKHSEVRDMLKQELGLGFGDANTLAHVARQAEGGAPGSAAGSGEVLDTLYSGPKAALRPIHEILMARLAAFGDFDIVPKKTYVSLRRRKQFAMIGPATNTRVEAGINMSALPPSARLEALPPKGMCNFRVKLTSPAEVDDELIDWLKLAYDAAG